jgi:predicted metal-binding membrane protein
MMVAMMLPSAAPAILLYAPGHRHSGSAFAAADLAFLAGYLACWLGFSLARGAGCRSRNVAGCSMRIAAPARSRRAADRRRALPAVAAQGRLPGRCRSPAQVLARHWRPGAAGALRLGLLHGAYCVGCCWLLMACCSSAA